MTDLPTGPIRTRRPAGRDGADPPIRAVWGGATDVGRRRRINEDALLAEPPVFLVADGMGGHEAGEVASGIVVETFGSFVGRPALTVTDVRRAFRAALDRVRELEGSLPRSAGTTVSGVAIAEEAGAGYWLVFNLGDSRTYRLAEGVFEQISVDHSVVQELLDSGEIQPADVASHPHRNVITRALGAGSDGDVDYWFIPAEPGDRILVCSDGLTTELDDDVIARALLEETDPQQAAARLVHEGLVHGGRDNLTVVVVDALAVAGRERSSSPERDRGADAESTLPRRERTIGADAGGES